MEDKVIQIKVAGLLDHEWGHLFDGWTVEQQADNATIISSVNADQSALHGMLTKIRDLNLKLVSVDTIHPCRKYPVNNESSDNYRNGAQNKPKQGIDIFETLWYIYFISYFMDGKKWTDLLAEKKG
ncbi:hypothetical protein ACFLVR_01835 [Chloroflexota bacterium]